jgi:hypothetical protein
MLDVLLRGDFKSRMDGYAIARNWGIFNANECRDKENMNRYTDGDIYLQPLNMVEAGTKPPPVSADQPSNAKSLLAYASYLVALEEARGNPTALNGRSNGAVHEQA